MNPPQSGWVTVNLPGTYKRIDGSLVSSVTLQPKQGVVLLGANNTSTGGSTSSSSSSSTSTSTSGLSVAITYPSTGWTMARGPIELWSLASGAVSVSYYLNGTWIGTATGGGPYFHVWYNFSSWAPAWYSLTAVAQDSSGHTASAPAVSLYLQ